MGGTPPGEKLDELEGTGGSQAGGGTSNTGVHVHLGPGLCAEDGSRWEPETVL